MFTTSLQEEVKALEEHMEGVREKVQDDMLCAKIRQFVDAPLEIQRLFKADAGTFPGNVRLLVNVTYSCHRQGRREHPHHRPPLARSTTAQP